MNLLQNIAVDIREHYLKHFFEEFTKQKAMLASEEKEGWGNCYNPRLVTDCELEFFPKEVKLASINRSSSKVIKLYRRDIVIRRDRKLSETLMCWPIQINERDKFVEEDIPRFKPFYRRINQTEIEIKPFPWFHCNIVFYPNAESIKGILDIWFYKWFFTNRNPDPFLNVIHRIDGPYKVFDGGESYSIDFGTAPPEAFYDLLFQICRNGVKRLIIN